MSIRTASPLATLAAVAAFSAHAPATAGAQHVSAVTAKLTLIGNAAPCINTALTLGVHDVSASCTAPSESPTWCPGLTPGSGTNCAMAPDTWRAMGLDEVSGTVRASNTNGQLRVQTGLVVETKLPSNTAPGWAGGYESVARASWSDKIDLGPDARGEGMWALFSLWAHGDQSILAAYHREPVVIEANTSTRFGFSFDMNTDPSGAQVSSDWQMTKELRSAGTPATRVQSFALGEFGYAWRYVAPEERYLSFAYEFWSESRVPGAVQASNFNYLLSSTARGDFGSTAGLAGVQFFGADRSTALTDVQYAFVNGTQFVTPTTTAPEPATWALLGTGLAALGVVTRRRRAAA